MSTKEREALREVRAVLEAEEVYPDLLAMVRAALDAPEAQELSAHAIKLIAECRDAFPPPPVGTDAEGYWAQAIGDPESVPDYLRAVAAAQASAQELSDEAIDAIGHRKAWRYKASSDPHHSSTYMFNRTCLIEFARAIIAAKAQGGSHG